ncbi:MAG: acetate--CoA ligase family protein [Deltaproteobacteria bacterium]
MKSIDTAVQEGRTTLSEHESKQLLTTYDIPVTREILVKEQKKLISAAQKIGFPLVMKGNSQTITHKTEKGLIRVDIRDDNEVKEAFEEITRKMGDQGDGVLLLELIRGQRELVVGLTRDPQFGPCVMFGLGGIFTEILKDISFRVAPLEKRDALDMMQEIKGRKILEAVRGMEAADLDMMAHILINVGRIGLENDAIKEIDINPLILSGPRPVAVDALVVLERKEGA